MLVKRGGFYLLSTLANFKDLACAFSTTEIGDIRDEKPRDNLAKILQINKDRLVKGDQTHSGKVKVVKKDNVNRALGKCDGLVTKEKNIFLMILVADCLPIVAFDPEKEVVGIAHAGWKGTVANISGNLIKKFEEEEGSNPKNILIGFGPCIEFCHYDVGSDLVNTFEKVGLKNSVLKSASGKFFVDLKLANARQLEKSGVSKSNIDMTLKACTFENPQFYSFRKDKTDKRFAAIVGMKNEA